MKILIIIIILVVLIGFSIALIPPVAFIAAHLGMNGLAVLSIRPDQNMDYAISVSTPDDNIILFSGQTGCQHKVGVNGSGYSTINRVSTDEKNEWLLYGIDCNYGINEKYHPGYQLFSLSDPVSTSMFFVNDNSTTQIVKETFKSTIFSKLNKKATIWPNYNDGPYFYRKIILKEQIQLKNNNQNPVVVYNRQTCGKENRLHQKAQINSKLNYQSYQKYSSGMLGYSPRHNAWEMLYKIKLDKPLRVAREQYKKTTDTNLAKLPAGCLFLKYGEETFIVSENTGAFLYIPEENAMIDIKRVHASDFKTAIEDMNSWYTCEQEVNAPILHSGEAYIDRSKYTITRRGIEKVKHNRRLIKSVSGRYLCSDFSRMRWL